MRKEIGPLASPDLIQFSPGLPKTRSGKIMRRILRKIAEDDFSNLGDTSTLAEPAVVDDLVNNRQNKKQGGRGLRLARASALVSGEIKRRRPDARPAAPMFPSAWLSSLDQADHEQDDNRADRGVDDRADDAAERRRTPAAKDRQRRRR